MHIEFASSPMIWNKMSICITGLLSPPTVKEVKIVKTVLIFFSQLFVFALAGDPKYDKIAPVTSLHWTAATKELVNSVFSASTKYTLTSETHALLWHSHMFMNSRYLRLEPRVSQCEPCLNPTLRLRRCQRHSPCGVEWSPALDVQ